MKGKVSLFTTGLKVLLAREGPELASSPWKETLYWLRDQCL